MNIIMTTQARLAKRWPAWLSPMGRFLAWWFGLFALLGPLSTCPVCGQAGCAGGIVGAGIFGGIITGLLWVPRWIVRRIKGRTGTDEGGAE